MITEGKKYYKIINDLMFQLIFIDINNRDLLKKLIEEVLQEKIETIDFAPIKRDEFIKHSRDNPFYLLAKTNHGNVYIELNYYTHSYIHCENAGNIFSKYCDGAEASGSYLTMGDFVQINLTAIKDNDMPFCSVYKFYDLNSKEEYIDNLVIYDINLNKTKDLCYSGSGYEILSMLNMEYQELKDLKGDKYMEKLRDESLRLHDDEHTYEFISVITERKNSRYSS